METRHDLDFSSSHYYSSDDVIEVRMKKRDERGKEGEKGCGSLSPPNYEILRALLSLM